MVGLCGSRNEHIKICPSSLALSQPEVWYQYKYHGISLSDRKPFHRKEFVDILLSFPDGCRLIVSGRFQEKSQRKRGPFSGVFNLCFSIIMCSLMIATLPLITRFGQASLKCKVVFHPHKVSGLHHLCGMVLSRDSLHWCNFSDCPVCITNTYFFVVNQLFSIR